MSIKYKYILIRISFMLTEKKIFIVGICLFLVGVWAFHNWNWNICLKSTQSMAEGNLSLQEQWGGGGVEGRNETGAG
jgi:hypothetical protein